MAQQSQPNMPPVYAIPGNFRDGLIDMLMEELSMKKAEGFVTVLRNLQEVQLGDPIDEGSDDDDDSGNDNE